MKICAITCTCGRHSCLERVVRFFLEQDYENKIQLIYNNSGSEQRLNKNVPENVILINNNRDRITKEKYTSTGAIFRDALSFVPEDVEVVTHLDDDDIYLPNHLSEGIKGIQRAHLENKVAYKPYFSYYKYSGGITKAHNNMEPSVFVDIDYLKTVGYRETSVDYHQQWLDELNRTNKILVDQNGEPTFIYDWSGQTGVFKLSGGRNDTSNFEKHKVFSKDEGDGIITPISTEKAKNLCKVI